MRRFLALFMMLILSGVLTFAQNRIVTGRVTDDKGNPVAGATVRLKGSKKGTAADADGNYSINAPKGSTLVVSGVGFASKDIPVADAGAVNVTVTRSGTELTGVVVTGFGQRRQAKQLGYSTAQIGNTELNQAKVTNIATGLAAKVSGLQVNLVNNGVKPDTRITLRGNRSILGNNQALLVVDGIQLPISYISSLSPNDVDNITVLKGASAAAIYGSDASNGVIIVTTKKGTKGKPRIVLSSTINMESVSYTPNFQNEFGTYGGENDPNAYPGIVFLPGNPYVPYVPYENQSYGPRFNGQKVPLGPPIRVYNPDGTYTIKQDSTTYSAIPNAKKGFFNTGLTFINNLSYSTGDEKSLFFLSFEDVNTTGIIPNDVNRRNTIRANGSKQYGIFKADYNIGYSLTHTNTTPGTGVPFNWGNANINGNQLAGGYTGGGSYFQNRPVYWTIINTPAFVDLRKYRDWQNNPFANPNGYFNAYYGNPWWQIDQTRLDEKNNNFIGNIALTLSPLSWLDLQYRAGVVRNDYRNKYTQAGFTFAPWAIADTLGSGNIPSGVKKLSPSQGDGTSSDQRIQSDFLAIAHKTFGDIDVRVLGGTQYRDNTINIVSASASTLVLPDFYNINNGLGIPSVNQTFYEIKTVGVFGDVTLGYKNFLFVHGSLRNDWSSLLAQNHRSYLYPGGDMAFVFTDAISSLKNNKILSFGKIRAALSKTGQVSISPYSLQNTFNSGAGFPYGNTAGYSVNSVSANPDIKPEFTNEAEVGLELGFLKNRINVSAAYYHQKTINQTIPISISAATGFTSAVVNTGEMSNKGIEIDIKVTPVQNKNVRWDIGMNYSNNKNTLESLGFGLTSVPVGNNDYAIVGQPYPVRKTTDWLRDPQGRIIVDPKTGYPSLNPNPQVFGTTNPPIKIGFNTSVNYMGFTLAAVVDGRFGAIIYNGIGPDLDFTGVSAYSASSGRQPFVIPNSSYPDPNKPGSYIANTNINTKDGNNLFWANVWNTAGSNYITSADFWKLRELSLTYTFPAKVIKHIKALSGLSAGFVGRNLIVWRPKDNVWTDPEFANTTGNAVGTTDINQLPPTRFYGFNLTLTF